MPNLPEEPQQNPMNHPEEQPSGVEGAPKFGRLLIFLIIVVLGIGLLTWASEAYYS
jgi:hypothetical protein